MNIVFFLGQPSKAKGSLGIKLNSLVQALKSDQRVNYFELCESYVAIHSAVSNQIIHCCVIYLDGRFSYMQKVIHLLHFKGIHIVLVGKKSDDIRYAIAWKSFDFMLLPFTKYHIDWMMSKLYSSCKNVFSALDKQVFFKVKNSKLVRVSLSSIIYFESLGNHVKIILSNSQRLVIYSTMKSLEQRLPPSHFVRVHKSYLVNLSKVNSIEGNFVIVEGKSIPVSRSNWKGLIGKLEMI